MLYFTHFSHVPLYFYVILTRSSFFLHRIHFMACECYCLFTCVIFTIHFYFRVGFLHVICSFHFSHVISAHDSFKVTSASYMIHLLSHDLYTKLVYFLRDCYLIHLFSCVFVKRFLYFHMILTHFIYFPVIFTHDSFTLICDSSTIHLYSPYL